MKLSEELKWRGLANQTTFETIEAINEPRTFYLGVDPSAVSMHIGNLTLMMVAKHLINGGHKCVLLVGGATGMIGDPKEDEERDLKTLEEIAKNKAGIAEQYKQLLEGDSFELVDNYDWFKEIRYLDFLRDVGKHFSMTQLLDRDFVKSRIGKDGVGISYAEFSYGLIQGYDFLHLHRTKGVTMQIGGSDQWGNMLSGAQMIRRLAGADAHVWTAPLIIDKSSGKKFGKSEGNAVWLNPEMTSPYKYYQFWLNVDDEMAKDLVKIFTLIEPDGYEALVKEFTSNPKNRALQKYLAYEATKLVHGEDKAESARNVSAVLFGITPFEQLLKGDIDMLAEEIPATTAGDVTNALLMTETASSKGEVRRLLEGGAISVNGEKISEDMNLKVPSLIKKGKNTFILVQ